jgi:hypothetical protein
MTTAPSRPITVCLVDMTTDATPANLRPGAFLSALAQALDEQVQGPFAQAYGQQLVTLVVGTCETRQPTDVAMNFRDTLDVQGALAYHMVVGGVPDIEIGCDLFASLGDEGEAMSQGAGHELLEMLLDPGANLWEDMTTGLMRAKEACDTVQNTGYKSSNGLWMTNFLLPAAWVPGAPGPWDYLAVMQSQDDWSKGYEIQAAPPSAENQVGGMKAPGRLGESIGHHVFGSVFAKAGVELSSMQLARKRSRYSRTYRRGVRL